jgi:hypothetical protein
MLFSVTVFWKSIQWFSGYMRTDRYLDMTKEVELEVYCILGNDDV